MIQEATGRLEHGEAIERQLTEVDAFPLGQRAHLGGGDNAGVTSPEDELALAEVPLREDSLPLCTRVANLDIADHDVTVLVTGWSPMAVDTDEGLLCIMFTDLVGWTELGERVGDDAADALRRDHFASVRAALSKHRGNEIKTVGDSVMSTFRSALDALRCAVEIQQEASSGDVRVRIGLHAGEPIADDGDVFGTAVNVASRLCAAAAPDEIVVSELTRSLVGRRAGFAFESTGPLTLKGLAEPIMGFRVRAAQARPTTPAASVAFPPAQSLRAVQPMLCPIVVGRERELELLGARIADAASGVGGVIGLVGEAGVGKTRLCEEVTRRAREAGMTVLAGRAVPSETPVPYRPFTEALLGAFRSAAPPDTPELVGFRGQLGRLVPAWRSDDAGGADESPVLLGEALIRLLGGLGHGNGCVVLLEDLHWADAETLAVVDYVIDASRDERVLTVCTSRPSGAATDVLSRLRRRDATSLIGVDPLGFDDIKRVVAACLSTDDPPHNVVELIKSHSDGNPFLVEELLAGLVASEALSYEDGQWVTSLDLTPAVPVSFGDSIRQRLSTLDSTALRVLGAAAVLGRRFDWELLPGVAEVDGRAVLDGLRRGVDEQLIEVEGSGFKFRHALTREAILGELLPPERRDFSSRAWPAVERANPGLPGPWCELAAELAEAAGEFTHAAARLVESASRALANGAFTSAEATARRAIRLAAGDPDVTDDAEDVLVQTLALAGKPEQAMSIGTALVDRLTDGSAAADRRAGLLIVLARAAIAKGDHQSARQMADRARALVIGGTVDESLAARVDAVAAHVCLAEARLEDAEARAHSAIALAAATEQPAVECEALEVVGRIVRTRNLDESSVWFERSAKLAERHGLTSWLIRARAELAGADWTNGRTGPLLEIRDFAARHGALVTVAHMDLGIADFALSAFHRDACFEAAQRCVEASRRYGLAALPVAELWLAGAHALAGNEAEMEAAAARALAKDPEDPRILGDLWGRVRATLAIVRDDRKLLRTALDAQMDFARVAPITTSIYPNRYLWALVHVIDDDDLGAAAREEIAAASTLRVWPGFVAGLEMLEAVAEGRAGSAEAATERFAAASRELHTSSIAEGTIHYHHVLAAEAALRDGWGEPATWLRAPEAFFTDRGYDVVARLCRSLLAQAGAPVPRRGRGESEVPPAFRALGVTSREMDVLHLVAEGLSNREIADRLFLSPKTVERHLTSLFHRTGLRNRGDLGAFVRSQDGGRGPAN